MKDAAFEALFKRYYNEAMLYVCSLTHNRELADEIVAEAFFRAFTTIDEEKDGFKFWLFKVCRNCYFDHLRKSKRLTVIDENMQGDEGELVERVIKNEEYRALYRAISLLKDNYREIIGLFYFGGLSVREIADITEQSVSNVKVVLFRARTRLKELLEDNHEF